MKKLLCLLLVLAMVFSLSATLISCGDDSDDESDESVNNGNDKPGNGGNGNQHSCADVDADFKCDDPTCGAFICRGQHKDYDGNGACDGKGCTFSFAMAGHTTHIDAVVDGKCDICEAPITEQHTCADANYDHYCDVCQAYICGGVHLDSNGDGICDDKTCKFDFVGAGHTVCADNDGNFKCDICGAFLCAGQHKDYDGNGICDGKGCAFNFAENGHTSHVDANTDNVCDICEAKIPQSTPSNPNNPSNPSDPSNPNNPSNPSDPGTGTNPSDPNNPGKDPSDPNNPGSNPGDDPSNPNNPGSNPGADPGEPTEGLSYSFDSMINGYYVYGGSIENATSIVIPAYVDGIPVVALTTVGKVCEKTVSGIREVKARGAYVVSVCAESLVGKYDIPCDEMIVIPDIEEMFAMFPTITVLQLLAYHVSALKGLDVDKPRNLAKSVTVE